MYSTWTGKTYSILVLAFLMLYSSVGLCQDKGNDDLDEAFDKKIAAQSTKDLDKVVSLCESAIEKGLDDEGEAQAKELAASALYEHADQLGQRIFASRGQDRRWRVYRSQALSRLSKAIDYQPDLLDAYLMVARLNTLPGGNEEDASEAIDKAIGLAEDDSDVKSKALLMRASISEDEESRIADLNEAIKLNPNNTDAIRVRGAYFLSQNETEKAVEDINKWLESGEPSTTKYMETVDSLMRMGPKFDEKLQKAAVDIIDKAIEHDPENPTTHLKRAQLNVIREKADDAIEDATRAIEIDRRHLGALLFRATIYADQEKLDEALTDINDLLELAPDVPQAIQMRASIYSQKEEFGKAIRDFKRLANSDPSNQFLQRQLAMHYNANDEPSKAIKIYNALLKKNSEEQWEGKSNDKKKIFINRRLAVLRGRGDARLSTGEHKKAVADYDDALKLAKKIRRIEEEEGEEEPMKNDDGVLNNLAWVLATSTDDEVRDGERSIKLATEAAEITEFKQAHILSTLASGYAEAGDFENALKWINKGIEINREEGELKQSKRNDEQKESLQKEKESYERNEPWREMQNVEKEKAEKEKAEKEAEDGDGSEDEDDSEEEDEPEEDEKEDKDDDN